MPKAVNIRGMRFTRLVAICPTDKRSGNDIVWECQCDCGNTVFVNGSSLRRGITKSCGCYKIDTLKNIKTKNLTGQRFGRLVVIEKSEKNSCGHVCWRCLCDCGNESIAIGNNLRKGLTKSCGCLHKQLLAERNTTHGMSHTREYIASSARKRRENKKLHDSNWTFDMEKALRKLQPVCVICGSDEYLQVDHVNPLSKGNGLQPGNAVVLCRACNIRKHNKDIDELTKDIKDKILVASKEFENSWYDSLPFKSRPFILE